MACVALTCLMSTIELEFLQPTPWVPRPSRVSLCEDAPIKSLVDNLSSLQEFLQGESASRLGAAIKDLEMEIRDFALEAEDAIEIHLSRFLVAKDDTECEEDKASQELHQTLREAAEKAAELLSILNTTTIRNEDDEVNEYVQWSLQDFELDVSLCHPPRLENKMVGRDDDYETIKYQLLRKGDSSELKLICLVGMTGIGKTHLAKRVYEDPIMKQVFEVQVWITMPPQKYHLREILCNLFLSIAAPTTELSQIIKRSTPWELANQVRKHLMGTKFLIVLNNFWNTPTWADIRQCFPDKQNGSRILLTTTHFDQRYYVNSYVHNMTFLDSTSSWDIFCNIILSLNKDRMAPIFEKIRSRVIVEKCDGLPMLIVAVAKRLSTCDNIQHEGKRIEKELDSIGILDRTSLTFLFNQLPLHLKVCFLYLGVFPKRSEILVKILIGLWSAEGFVKSEYTAYSYLQELIDRSLVLIGNRGSFDGKIKTCRMHSSLHSFCVGEAQKEGIFCAVNTQQHLGLPLDAFANSCRWLSFCTHSFDYYVLFSTNYSRSIFFFLENPEMFAPPNLLRVLAFVSSQFFQRIPKRVGNLVFLRYLSVTQWFEGLGDIVSANPNLQTLIVYHSESQLGGPTIQLPSTIWEPPRLRHLELGNMYRVNPPSMVKENLQTLSLVVGPSHCGKEFYFNFPNLRKLKIFCKEDLELSQTDGSSTNHIILDNLECMKELEVLTILVSIGCSVAFPELSSLPFALMKLRLSGTNLSERNLEVISKLPNLQVLKLENAYHGKVWKVAGGFSRLRLLLLEAKKLEQMMANGYSYPGFEDIDLNSFPRLERLVLRSCYRLKEIHLGFTYIDTLQSIELDKCSRSAVMSAKTIQEEQYRCGNSTFKIKIMGPEYDESESVEDVGVGKFEKANSEIKTLGPEYNESGPVEDVGVGEFEKENFEMKIHGPEYDEPMHIVKSVENVGVAKFKFRIQKVLKKGWTNLFRCKPKSGSSFPCRFEKSNMK